MNAGLQLVTEHPVASLAVANDLEEECPEGSTAPLSS